MNNLITLMQAAAAGGAKREPWNILGLRYLGDAASEFTDIFGVSSWPLSGSNDAHGVEINPDGTKLYILDANANSVSGSYIHQYSLSPANTLSRVTYYGSLHIPQGFDPSSLRLKDDGTKAYILSNGNISRWGSVIITYNLSTAWDITTATPEEQPNWFYRINITPTGLFFKPDGTKMYIPSTVGDLVYEYDLSSAWDVWDATLVNTLYVGDEEATPQSVSFKPDGTKMYVTGSTGDYVNEYDLSTAWDISTASYVQNFYVNTQEAAPSEVFFKSDGTKMYICGTSGDEVNEYDLSTAWDVSTASYLQNFSVGAQDTAPSSLFFKPDGTKMYVGGNTNYVVYEYDLSTAWDVSSASYVQSTPSLLTPTSYPGSPNPAGIFFNSDGTTLFIASTTDDTVIGYPLSTAWDLSSITVDITPSSGFLSVYAQDAYSQGLAFGKDGTRLYFTGFQNSSVYQYNLSTAWDISTATYARTFSVAAQETTPTGVFFDDDGNTMFISGTTADNVNEYHLSNAQKWEINTANYTRALNTGNAQDLCFTVDGSILIVLDGDLVNLYDLSTAWDLSSASDPQIPTGDYLSNSSYGSEANRENFIFNLEGTKLFKLGNNVNNEVQEYSLSTAWDITTLSYVNNYVFTTQETDETVLFVSFDGKKLYIGGFSSDSIHQYTLTTAWDLTTVTYNGSLDVSATDIAIRGLWFNNEGTKMYFLGLTNDAIHEFDLSSAWTITSATFSQSFSILPVTDARGISFKYDGTQVYFTDIDTSTLYQYTLSTPWDISTATFTNSYFLPKLISGDYTYFFFKPDGTKLYVDLNPGLRAAEKTKLVEFEIGPAVVSEYPWSLDNLSHVQTFSISAQEASAQGIFFKPDGTKMYILGSTGDDVNEYDLSTAWDISTASYLQNFSVAAQEGNPADLFFKPDGTKMYVIGTNGDDVNEYDLSTAWDISTASYVQNFSVSTQHTIPEALYFKPDGTSFYVSGTGTTGGGVVDRYDLSTAWDISTASWVNESYVPGLITSGIFFTPDGRKMFTVGASTDTIYEFDLFDPWNITIATEVQSVSIRTEEDAPNGIFIKPDGTKLYIVGQNGDEVNEYNI